MFSKPSVNAHLINCSWLWICVSFREERLKLPLRRIGSFLNLEAKQSLVAEVQRRSRSRNVSLMYPVSTSVVGDYLRHC